MAPLKLFCKVVKFALRVEVSMTARLWPLGRGLIWLRLIEHHIGKLAHARLCGGSPAGAPDISSEVLFALIAERYESRSLGLTSNLTFSE